MASNHPENIQQLQSPLGCIVTAPLLSKVRYYNGPKKRNPPHLIDTIESYLKNLPERKPLTGLYSRIQFVVYTYFTHHAIFDTARSLYSSDLKASQYITWVREEGTERDQQKHVSKALQNSTTTYRSTYTAVLEGDFPVCEGRWQDILDAVYRANLDLPSHCGLFVGPGGSGLIFKQNYAVLASRALFEPAGMKLPLDVALQDCLLGDIPSCSACKENLVISQTLLMYHIGYNTSTSDTRKYSIEAYQCGWRHPFHGNTHLLNNLELREGYIL